MRECLGTGADLPGGAAHRVLEQFRHDCVAALLVEGGVGDHHGGVAVGDRRRVRSMDLTTGEGVEHDRPLGEPLPEFHLTGSGSVGYAHRPRIPAGDRRMPELHRQTTSLDLRQHRVSGCNDGTFVGGHLSERGHQFLVPEPEHIPPCLHPTKAIPTHRQLPTAQFNASNEYESGPSRSRDRRRIPSG